MRRRIYSAILTLASFVATARGLDIIGPDRAPVYKRAAWTANVKPGQSVSWAITPRGVADIQQVGNDVLVWGPPGKYELELLVIDFDARTQERYYKNVEIGNPSPNPPDNPPPIPSPNDDPKPPAPDIPPGRYGLAVKSYQWTKSLTDKDRKAAPAIANAFRSVGQSVQHRLEDGITVPRTAVLDETKAETVKVLSASGADWKQWFLSLQAELDKLDLKKPEQIIEAWAEITDGIETAVRSAAKK